MNFEMLQTIWDSQNNQKLLAIDESGIKRIVDKQSRLIASDLREVEFAAIVAFIGLAVAVSIDTFFNGKEYFQLFGVSVNLVAATWLWFRRRARERKLRTANNNLIEKIDQGITRVRVCLQRWRDLFWYFTIFGIYGVSIRVAIYGWEGSEAKALATAGMIVFLLAIVESRKRFVDTPRLESLSSLRTKLVEDC